MSDCKNCGGTSRRSYKLLARELTQSKARIRELEEALREIKDTQGKVCENYELCQHTSCSSSYSSWAIADKALSEKSDKEK